jgi:hypothetical protein
MTGSFCGVCTRPTSNTPDRCKRRIGAEKLERFITDAAKKTLTEMTVAQLTPSTPARTRIMASVEEDHTRLAELKAEWINKKLPTDDYIEMRTAVAKRIATAERATVVRPVTAVEGMVTGPGAGAWFDGLELDRQNAALKFLFSAVRIGPHTGRSGTFDLSRIDPEPRRINL